MVLLFLLVVVADVVYHLLVCNLVMLVLALILAELSCILMFPWGHIGTNRVEEHGLLLFTFVVCHRQLLLKTFLSVF